MGKISKQALTDHAISWEPYMAAPAYLLCAPERFRSNGGLSSKVTEDQINGI
jgi:hypothetical protein